jgi:putative restriction endonuclease
VAYAVFIHRPDSPYDDRPEEHYQFPSRYLTPATACVGDWIVYLEPRRVPGARGYFAVAKVAMIVQDPDAPGKYLARIEPGSYLPFAEPVPFRDAAGVVERGVLNDSGRNSGRNRNAVRLLSPSDFARIVERGLSDVETVLPRFAPPPGASGFSDVQSAFEDDLSAERVRQLTSRLVRDRVFRKVVLRAYGERCAMTGLKLINGGGRAEAEAAHIQPVEAQGPDIVSNGIALSGTMHWMFDRGLLGLADDHSILVSRHINDPDAVRGLINKSGRISLPLRPGDHPHARFLRWHRENRFKA